jgi:hypothetical protein
MDADTLREIIVNYRTLDDAARQGMIKALDMAGPGRTEYGGVIFQDPRTGLYYLSDGKPMRGEKDEITIQGRPQKGRDRAAGAYHTHPPNARPRTFSDVDTATARATKFPFYMGEARDRTGHVFDALNHPERIGVGGKRGGPSSGREFMPGHRMVREDPSVLDADKAARRDADRSAELVAEILRKPR